MEWSNINWFVALSVPLYLGGAIHSYTKGNESMVGVYLCYAIANYFMVRLEYFA